MLCFPNAKINLGLHVLRKRNDGFHDIETLFYPLPLCDSLEILTSVTGDARLTTYGIDLPDGDNLVMKAYRMLAEKYNLQAVDIHLIKNIPIGAGLGGGSSDAAHTLLMLNNLFKLHLGNTELEELAAELGSDCPFFIRNTPTLAKGRGELMEDFDLDLSSCRFEMEHPAIHISSAEAYAMVRPDDNRPSLREIIKKPIGEWKDLLVNDFETPIFEKYPEIKDLKNSMYERGAIYASMSGSGSSVYGIFNKSPHLL